SPMTDLRFRFRRERLGRPLPSLTPPEALKKPVGSFDCILCRPANHEPQTIFLFHRDADRCFELLTKSCQSLLLFLCKMRWREIEAYKQRSLMLHAQLRHAIRIKAP